MTPMNSTRHLFTGVVELDYLIESYSCRCGATKFIIKQPHQECAHVCDVCGNDTFFDANMALENFAFFLQEHSGEDFEYLYTIKKRNEAVESCYALKIPFDIDLVSQKIFYEEKSLYTLKLTHEGVIDRTYFLHLKDAVVLKLERQLLEYVEATSAIDLPKPKNKKMSLQMVAFFLQNRHLRDVEFFYWKWGSIPKTTKKELSIVDALMAVAGYPKAKSVKKAIFRHYRCQMMERGRFDPVAIELFCNSIEDPNILVRLLDLPLEYMYESDVGMDILQEFVEFLKKYYTQKQILTLFASLDFYEMAYIFDDMLNEFNTSKEMLKESFHKVACKPVAFHDEFVQCALHKHHKEIYTKTLSYTKIREKPCIEIEGYEVRLPKNGKELVNWAKSLHNCMAGYFYGISNDFSTIYCFFQNEEICFAVEISDGKIIQARGKYNRGLTKEESEIVQKWYERTLINHERTKKSKSGSLCKSKR